MSNLTIARSASPRRQPQAVRVARRAAETPRDWRLAAFGGSCTALGIACLMLAACSSTPIRGSAPAVEAPIVVAPAAPAAPAETPPPEVTTNAPAPVPGVPSPWQRLRFRFGMPGCDYNPAVRHWAHVYTQSTNAFAGSLSDAMPFLLVVMDELERRKVPGEFAFLPYIESTYTPIATSGDHAAGIWQLMPDTAKEAGLTITSDYDGRLDVAASTKAALDLVQRYYDEFGDWRIADMAYNAGEYGLRGMVPDNRDDRTPNEIARIRVHPGVHEHLAKLLAVACVISQPERFKVNLPEPDWDDRLVLIELPAPIDLELAARLAGVDLAKLQHWNAGYTRARMPANAPHHLLIPQQRRSAFEQTLGKLPQYAWRDWHPVTLKLTETMQLFASETDLDASALAAVNGVEVDAPLAPGTHLLLPGRAANDSVHVDVMPAPVATRSASGIATVHAGDTLWAIAHQQGVHLDDLMRWNGLTKKSTLHLGQHLRLTAPEAPAGGAVAAATAPN